MSPQWIIGDENGLIKHVACPKASPEQLDLKYPAITFAPVARVLINGSKTGAVQKLAFGELGGRNIVSFIFSLLSFYSVIY